MLIPETLIVIYTFLGFLEMKTSVSTLVRGFQCPPRIDLNTDFFVQIIRNQDLGCLLRGGLVGFNRGVAEDAEKS